jgi:hypothetical protein
MRWTRTEGDDGMFGYYFCCAGWVRLFGVRKAAATASWSGSQFAM